MLLKYEKPKLIDLNFRSAQGNCAPTGSGDIDDCTDGNVAQVDCSTGNTAQHTGANSCAVGNSAIGHCKIGNAAVQK